MAAASAESLAHKARLEDLDLLARASPPALAALKDGVRFMVLRAGERLSAHAAATEHYYFVVSGQVGVVVDTAGAVKDGAPNGRELRELKKHWQFVSAFGQGDFFSDDYVLRRKTLSGPTLDVVAEETSVLATLSREALTHALDADPALREALTRKNAELRRLYHDNRSAARRLIQDFFLRHGLGFAGPTKVMQVDRCIGCNACEDACATRHGVSRIERLGPSLGLLTFPVACRSCSDHRCLDACAFDAIRVADDGTVAVNREKCAGCSACAVACPSGSIKMVEAPYIATDFPNPMPDTTVGGATNVPGVYLVGEAAGDALIKVAINSGVRAIDAVIAANRGSAPENGVDVIIVGAGPAGLSAALSCRERKLSFALFDKGTFATTIQEYPRHKIVMAEPAHIPLYGQLWLKDTTREELIARWQEVIDKTGLTIHSHEAVEAVTRGPNGALTVKTQRGTYLARCVVVAVGTRGTPRKLGVAGETGGRVRYALGDPVELAGQHLLVVGGGDSAVEAAMSLADVRGTTVTLSYRKDSFGRIKARNKSRLAEYSEQGKLAVRLNSSVKAIAANQVTLALESGEVVVPNQTIFAMLGAEPPTKFFEAIGIRIVQPKTKDMDALAAGRGLRQLASKCDRCQGFDQAACIAACPTGAILEMKPRELFFTGGKGTDPGVANEVPFLLGIEPPATGLARVLTPVAVTLAALVTVALGLEVFLRKTAPEMSLLARWLVGHGQHATVLYEPGRGLGLDLAIAGSVLMLLAAAYPLHSRLGWFRSLAKKRWFMALHVWAGIFGPILVTYHTSLKLDRWPSIAFWAAWIVVLSGIIGRYLKSWLRRGAGLAELEIQSLEQARQRLRQKWHGIRGRTQILKGVEPVSWVTNPPTTLALFIYAGHWLTTSIRAIYLRHVKLKGVAAKPLRDQTVLTYVEHSRAVRRRMLAEVTTRTLVLWRRFHLAVTIGMFAVAITHVVLGLLYKAH